MFQRLHPPIPTDSKLQWDQWADYFLCVLSKSSVTASKAKVVPIPFFSSATNPCPSSTKPLQNYQPVKIARHVPMGWRTSGSRLEGWCKLVKSVFTDPNQLVVNDINCTKCPVTSASDLDGLALTLSVVNWRAKWDF